MCAGVVSMSEQTRRRNVIDVRLIRERKTNSRHVECRNEWIGLAVEKEC